MPMRGSARRAQTSTSSVHPRDGRGALPTSQSRRPHDDKGPLEAASVVYDGAAGEALQGRATLGGPCGKRLAPFMREIVAALQRRGELVVTPHVRGNS